MSHFSIKFMRELAKTSFGSIKAVWLQMDFTQMGFFFINKCLFPPSLKSSTYISFLPFSSLTNVRENKTLFVCFLYLIGDQFFSSLVVLQVKRTADTLLATLQGGFLFCLFFHKTLHCASFLSNLRNNMLFLTDDSRMELINKLGPYESVIHTQCHNSKE